MKKEQKICGDAMTDLLSARLGFARFSCAPTINFTGARLGRGIHLKTPHA